MDAADDCDTWYDRFFNHKFNHEKIYGHSAHYLRC